MPKLVLETEAREFINSYSHYKDTSVTAIDNKLITRERVNAMGGHVISTYSNRLVPRDQLVAYQVPNDKLQNSIFYFSNNGGFNHPLTLSRRLYSNTVFDGINGGNHPTLSFVKNTSTNTNENTIGGLLWDQLNPPSNMTLTWQNSSAPSVARSYLLKMPIVNTTYGSNNTYYYIGKVIINCGQIGTKTIDLWYMRYVAPTYSTTVVFFPNNGTEFYQGYISFTYQLKNTSNSVVASGTITIPGLGPGAGTSFSKVISLASGGNQQFTVSISGNVSWNQYSTLDGSGTYITKTKAITQTILAYYPQQSRQTFSFTLN